VFRKFVIVFTLFFLSAALLPALDFSLRPGGSFFFPAGRGNKTQSGNDIYQMGGAGNWVLSLI